VIHPEEYDLRCRDLPQSTDRADPMRQLDRISRLFRLLSGTYRQRAISLRTLQEKLDGVAPATLKRDIAFLRDSLNMPVIYDRETNGYYIDPNPDKYYLRCPVPGLWISGREAYAFLTLYNVLRHVDPGVLSDLVLPLRGVLKRILADGGIRGLGFDRKIKIELGIPNGNPAALSDISYALAHDEAVALKFRKGSLLTDGEYLPTCLTLKPIGWIITATLASDRSGSLEIPLQHIVECVSSRPPEDPDLDCMVPET
jgi:hypothetical protein